MKTVTYYEVHYLGTQRRDVTNHFEWDNYLDIRGTSRTADVVRYV